MNDAFWIAVVVGLGMLQALQISLLGAMSRARGPSEAALISIMGTLVGMSLALAIRGWRGDRPLLPSPLDNPALLGLISLASATFLIAGIRGLPWGLAFTGLTAMPYLLAASFLSPRIGVGLFLAALIAGQLSGGVVLDQIGAFGGATRQIDLMRVIGIGMLLGGVVLVRGFR